LDAWHLYLSGSALFPHHPSCCARDQLFGVPLMLTGLAVVPSQGKRGFIGRLLAAVIHGFGPGSLLVEFSLPPPFLRDLESELWRFLLAKTEANALRDVMASVVSDLRPTGHDHSPLPPVRCRCCRCAWAACRRLCRPDGTGTACDLLCRREIRALLAVGYQLIVLRCVTVRSRWSDHFATPAILWACRQRYVVWDEVPRMPRWQWSGIAVILDSRLYIVRPASGKSPPENTVQNAAQAAEIPRPAASD